MGDLTVKNEINVCHQRSFIEHKIHGLYKKHALRNVGNTTQELLLTKQQKDF